MASNNPSLTSQNQICHQKNPFSYLYIFFLLTKIFWLNNLIEIPIVYALTEITVQSWGFFISKLWKHGC